MDQKMGNLLRIPTGFLCDKWPNSRGGFQPPGTMDSVGRGELDDLTVCPLLSPVPLGWETRRHVANL